MMRAMSGASVPLLREEYSQTRREICQRFLEERNPIATLERLSRTADQLIQRLADSYLSGSAICVLAVGGFGRAELCPFSDVDLLFLYEGSQQNEKAIKAVLHDLWDLKLDLGHQVWTLVELQDQEFGDFGLLLSLMDGRFVAGQESLAQELLEQIFPSYIQQHKGKIAEQIIRLTQERHQSFDNSLYHLEPNLKGAPGGLRDYLAGTWLRRLQSVQDVFSPYSEREVSVAHQFLLKLRILLHCLSERNQNQLTYALQDELADCLDYEQISGRSGMQTLMQDYFLHARVLFRFCQNNLRSWQVLPAVRTLDIETKQRFKTAKQVLEVFRRSIVEQCPLSDKTRNAVLQALPLFKRTLANRKVRHLLSDIFKPRPGLYHLLCEMYELGVLELTFPELKSIKALVIRDFYHKYTVDEHTLLAIKNIEDLLSIEEGSDLRFRSLLEETQDADLLTLALLFHDVGKSREGEHTVLSSEIAAQALRRFHYEKRESEVVLFLIRSHLEMSNVIFRRDLEEDQVIQRFVDKIPDIEHLRLLCLLTFADIKAVAPGTLNEWKKDLLWQLYVSAYEKLTLGFGEERIQEDDIGEKLLAGLPDDLGKDGFEEFLEGFPLRYLTSTSASEVYQHYQLASQLSQRSPIQIRLSSRKTHYELCVVTPERRHLFAKIVGILSYFDMNILRGFGFANRRNTVLNLFQFSNTGGTFRLNPEQKQELKSFLIGAIEGNISIRELLKGKEQSPIFRSSSPRFEPTIYFADDQSEKYSIMEIVAPDSIGLLYRIGREIAALDCSIELLLISTEGDKAVDVFYLAHKGDKLSAALREQLSTEILQSLG